MRKTLTLLLLVLLAHIATAADIPSQSYSASELSIPLPENTFHIEINDSLPLVYFQSEIDDPLFGFNAVLSVHSLSTGKKLWEKKFNTALGRPQLLSNGVLLCDAKNMKLLDNHTGKKKYAAKGRLASVVDKNRSLIAYRGEKNDKLIGIEAATGKELWKTKIGKNFGEPWSQLRQLSDSVTIYMGGNLWRLNTSDGSVREYRLRRQISDKKTNALMIGLGVLTGALTGVFMYGPTYFEGLGSEVATDSLGRMYVADRDAVACIDTDLNEVWRTPLPKGLASQSNLFIRNDTLDMLNTSVAFSGYRTRNSGKRFFASFGLHDGMQISLKCLPEDFDKNVFGETISFLPDKFFVYNKATAEYRPVPHRGDAYPVVGQNGDILMINANLNILATYPKETVFFYAGRDSDNIHLESTSTDLDAPVISIGPDLKIVDILPAGRALPRQFRPHLHSPERRPGASPSRQAGHVGLWLTRFIFIRIYVRMYSFNPYLNPSSPANAGTR